MKSLVSSVCFLVVVNLTAQVGIGTTTPDASSVLDVTATDKGILVPRVSLVDITDGTTPIATPTTSLLVWNTNAAVTGGNGVGYYYWNGTWEPLFGDNLGNHNATTTLDLNSNEITEVLRLSTLATSDYDKLRVYSSSNYTIGMHDAMTYGYLNDWATTFTMNNNANRGWIWRDVNDSQNDGAMSLTTDGRMRVKQLLDIPYTGDVNGTSGTGGIVIGTGTSVLRIDRDEIVTSNNRTMYIQTGNAGDLRIDSSTLCVDASTNRVGIGYTTPSYQLHLISNSAAKPSSSAWTVSSDERLKTNVSPFTDGLELLKQINPIWFTYNGKAGMPLDTGVGTLAQEFQKIAPYMVKPWEYTNEDDGSTETYLGIDYGPLTFVIVNAIQEQHETIESLETKNIEQQTEIDSLKIQLNNYKKLEARINALEANTEHKNKTLILKL